MNELTRLRITMDILQSKRAYYSRMGYLGLLIQANREYDKVCAKYFSLLREAS